MRADHASRLALGWLAADEPARWRELDGTAVLADLSGFTRLTESLTALGTEGAEVLHRALTVCFAGGHPSTPSGPGRLRSHQAQSSGSRETGSGCASSRAAQIGQCALDNAGRPSITRSTEPSLITRSATAGTPRFQLTPTGMPTASRT